MCKRRKAEGGLRGVPSSPFFIIKCVYVSILTFSTLIYNFKQILCLWAGLRAEQTSILAVLNNANILDKCSISVKEFYQR